MAKTKSTHPVLSVIIPMRNEQAVLDMLFERLLAVLDGVGEPYEIICINDGSTDETLARLTAMHLDRKSVE